MLNVIKPTGFMSAVIKDSLYFHLVLFLFADELPDLVTYCERMQNLFWPDWTQRCRGNGFVDDNHKLYTF